MRDRPTFDLFLVSWLVLFLELACIRWFPSHVLFLTFFTNTVLLACFVGMSIGCLVARRSGRLVRTTPYLLALAVGAGLLIDQFSSGLMRVFTIGNQANPDVVFFGTEDSADAPSPFTVPIEVVGAAFFALIAAVMVGPGQEMGRAFNRVSNRTTAYSANLLGSLAGIGMFAAGSYLRFPPVVWFTLVAAGLAYLLLRDDPDTSAPKPKVAIALIVLGLTAALTLVTSGIVPGLSDRETTWSPYYRIDYHPEHGSSPKEINTNLISQQVMARGQPTVAPYALPYLFQRDLKKRMALPIAAVQARPDYRAGSGNDVAQALRWIPETPGSTRSRSTRSSEPRRAPSPGSALPGSAVTIHLNDGRTSSATRSPRPTTWSLRPD